ncbi:Uncharacterised protein [Actinobacillus pleuropneumoniae]|uniref:Uncharacterized protein n=1 Tax=Paenibacillus lautus TaxID=1401 RepID=A0A385U3C2_PAELA|nr:hypothetical protein D5F53_32710 [Paenibacillus lautus]VTR56548.1 Uncharacterised protein [Actinobacillus pleuropneumoniae]
MVIPIESKGDFFFGSFLPFLQKRALFFVLRGHYFTTSEWNFRIGMVKAVSLRSNCFLPFLLHPGEKEFS